MSLPEFLDNLLLDETADPEDLEQYRFILGILREEGGNDEGDDDETEDEEKVGDDDEEDEVEEEDDEEEFTSAKAVIEDEEETLPPGGDDELRGEQLLADLYDAHSSASSKGGASASVEKEPLPTSDEGEHIFATEQMYSEEKNNASHFGEKDDDGLLAVEETKVGFTRLKTHRRFVCIDSCSSFEYRTCQAAEAVESKKAMEAIFSDVFHDIKDKDEHGSALKGDCLMTIAKSPVLRDSASTHLPLKILLVPGSWEMDLWVLCCSSGLTVLLLYSSLQ